MKITIEFPDDTLCAYVTFISGGAFNITMHSHGIPSSKFVDGATVSVKEEDQYGEPGQNR